MFCVKCGAKIEEGSKFCTKCGTPVTVQGNSDVTAETTSSSPEKQKDIQATVNDTLKNIQSNENVQKAQKSIVSGWSAIVAVLKDPTAKVSLGIGEMIVISIISVLCYTMMFYLSIGSIIKMILGGYASMLGVEVNFFLCLLAGIILPLVILCIYTLVHAVKDKGFSKFKENISGDVIGLILPSVFALGSGFLFALAYQLGAIALLMGFISILVYIFKVLKDTNQYILIIVTTVAILLLVFAAYLLLGMTAGNITSASSLF